VSAASQQKNITKKQNSPSTTGSGTRTLANGPSAANNPEVLPLNLPENGAGKDGV
jgi:hypothetical protein